MLRVFQKEVSRMSESAEKTSNAEGKNPFQAFRALRDAYLDAMAKAMVESVNSEGYAQATGAMLEGYLSAAAPFRQALEKSMLLALQQLELPSRQEVAVLAERFTNVEMRLDDMDAKLDSIAKAVSRGGPKPGAEPAGAGARAAKQAKPAANRPKPRRPAARRPVIRKPR
jgi:Poly(R)-hydroxyalkanoic acid synthase subunit (PHA_synth_III_E)